MQESIFNIFGTQSCELAERTSSTSSFQHLKGVENVKLKSSSVSDLGSTKKALGDVGNKMKLSLRTPDTRKLMLTNPDQENSFVNRLLKSSPQKSSSPIKNTPHLTSAVRSPLSDIKPSVSPLKPSVSPLKDKSQKVLYAEESNSLLSELLAIENFITGDVENLSWKHPDDPIDYEMEDDYEDILPRSLRPNDEDIHRMVHFWEMYKTPPELQLSPLFPLIEEAGNGFELPLIPSFDLEEPVSVPVPLEE